LYLPAHFEEKRTPVLHALMRARPLATLVTLGGSGLEANHIPVETLTEPPPHGLIRGHVARANPVWREYRADSEALAIFQGPQAYVSPTFYPSKQETGEVVPTWNYAVVHARGTLRFVQDTAWLRAFVERLTFEHERSREAPWRVEDAPPPYIEKMLSMIVGFEFSIASLTGKWKLSQNHPAANRRGVVNGLRAAAGPDSAEIADMLSLLDEERRDKPAGQRRANVLQTERLDLRQLELGDAEFILELLNEPAFLQFIGDKGIRNLDDARTYILKGPVDSYGRHGFGLYATCLRDRTPIGICGLVKRDGLADVDIGFAFLSRYRGQGYAVESAAAILAHARQVLGLQRIVAITSPENFGSIAVLEKIGMKFDRTIKLDEQSPELKLFLSVLCRTPRMI
jgi:transcriptional regulator